MNSTKTTIVLFRIGDLRVGDNPALHYAAKQGPVVPLFIWSEESGEWAPGGATRWWLHYSLVDLQKNLAKIGFPLVIRKGLPEKVILEVARQSGAHSVFWNLNYEPNIRQSDRSLKKVLSENSLEVTTYEGNLLFNPKTVMTKERRPYRVFTPFWNSCLKYGEPPKPLPAPPSNPGKVLKLASLELAELSLLPKIDWAQGFKACWVPGEEGALKRFTLFLSQRVKDYLLARDYPAVAGVSLMSPYLHFGEISARTLFAMAKQCQEQAHVAPYLRQLGWREFAHHLLYHFPTTTWEPLSEQYSVSPWVALKEGSGIDKEKKTLLRAWQKGETGYPIIDAGMRELWHTGWMHNRVRMIVGSFLVKDLLIPWQEGAKWFWDTLVDADLANNTLGWQWVAGCGADAAPFFRIFNPETQSEKFDAEGIYIRKWLPELAQLPNQWIHAPWKAPAALLRDAQVSLGKNYPMPIVDHAQARLRALELYASLGKGS